MQDSDPEKKKLRKVELPYLSSTEGRKIFPADSTRLMVPATAAETEASAPDGLALPLFITPHNSLVVTSLQQAYSPVYITQLMIQKPILGLTFE